jgi:ribonuclease III
MVNTNTLAQLAEQLDLGGYLYLGKGIAKGGGRNLKSLLANAFEAVLGAVFLDAGYDAAYHYYLDLYRALPSPVRDENFKGRLQQVAQERFGETPVYDSEGARVGNRREYTSVVFAGAEPLGTGHGASKQEAEQDAAKAALETLLGSAKPQPKQRRPRKRREPAPAPVAAEVVPMPEPRSRQFGEPIE